MCTSENDLGGNPFTQWTEPHLVLAPDLLDDEVAEERLAAAKPLLLYDHPDDHRCEFYGVIVWRTGDVFLGLIWIYDASYEYKRFGSGNQYAIVDVQLASSRDLLHWERLGDRQPVIARGVPDAFDSHMIFFHTHPVTVGYGAADCTPVTGNSLRHVVQWGDRQGDDSWRDGPVRLRFHLRDAALYGFRFGEEAA